MIEIPEWIRLGKQQLTSLNKAATITANIVTWWLPSVPLNFPVKPTTKPCCSENLMKPQHPGKFS
ncbi:hypothetical protein O9993_10255 [Vibrio lentus]|nr:hypothetical protein [Vibrio lentus]